MRTLMLLESAASPRRRFLLAALLGSVVFLVALVSFVGFGNLPSIETDRSAAVSSDRGATARPSIPAAAPEKSTGNAPAIVQALAAPATRPPAVSRAAARQRSLLRRLLSPGRFAYHQIVRRAAARYRVEHRLVMAIIASESGGDATAVSPAGAIGLMQLMPETAERLGVDPWDPEQNVDGAVRYLAAQLSTFKSIDLSLVAYNAGPGFAEKYRRGHVELGAETRAFLTRVGHMIQ